MPVPQPVTAPPLTHAERLVADLRSLANLAASHPEVAALLAETLSLLYLVVPSGSPASAVPDLRQLLVEAGAAPGVDPLFGEAVANLPAGTIRLAVVTPWAAP